MLKKNMLMIAFIASFLCGIMSGKHQKSSGSTKKNQVNAGVKNNSSQSRRSIKHTRQKAKKQSSSVAKMAQEAANQPQKRRRRKRNRSSEKQGPKVVKRTISTMNFDELKQSKEALMEEGNKEVAIKYLEAMIPLCTDMHELANIMTELGDMYYETERLSKAFAMYREFVDLYPGSDQVEYALYRAVVCKFDEICDAERDQSQAKETIKLAEEFLERSELFVTYKNKVEEILKKCRERLFENELSIFNFYLFRNRTVAATKRLDSIKKEFTPLLPELEPRIMMLEIELAQAKNNNELVEEKQDELITKFPDYIVQTAQNTKNKKTPVDRF